jgi:hypothetical protein
MDNDNRYIWDTKELILGSLKTKTVPKDKVKVKVK